MLNPTGSLIEVINVKSLVVNLAYEEVPSIIYVYIKEKQLIHNNLYSYEKICKRREDSKHQIWILIWDSQKCQSTKEQLLEIDILQRFIQTQLRVVKF